MHPCRSREPGDSTPIQRVAALVRAESYAGEGSRRSLDAAHATNPNANARSPSVLWTKKRSLRPLPKGEMTIPSYPEVA